MNHLIAIVTLMLALLGCGGSTSETSAHVGGSGGATASGGQGGQVPCEEPTPEGWIGPFQPYAAAILDNNALTVLPDEAGGLAGVGPKIGPFVCPHDFVQVGVSYRTQPLFGYEFARPAAVKLDFVMGDADGNPEHPPVFAEPTCYTDGTEPKCGPGSGAVSVRACNSPLRVTRQHAAPRALDRSRGGHLRRNSAERGRER